MIELRKIWFSYSGDRHVLRDVDAQFDRGLTVVMGPNGSGKTTLLKVSSLLYKATKGKVMVDGVDYWSLKDPDKLRVRREVIYVHESPRVIRGSVLDNLAYGFKLRGLREGEALREVLRLVELLNMKHLAEERAVGGLSIGEKQLIALVRALALKPRYLFLDEPLAHVHLSKRRSVVRVLEDLKDSSAIVVSTHDPLPLLSVADEALLIDEGRVVFRGRAEEALRLVL
ncbi:MAG: energy-coupling factor ABC transporter ATP-binding protein [Candidatus Nezhaarchaeota archaeon]|nr:energy-coupling factor ABC transporter ATP-binding protein [Candidatus Nezhaarchaeota archaeon]